MSNPVYAIAGFEHAVVPSIKDVKKLPLFVSVDPFINETSALADYIVPDTVTYESWGIGAPWADVIAKTSTVRWPVVEPATARTADGQPVNLESFLFAIAKELQLPGFGKGGMSTKDGEPVDLECAEDFYVRGISNIAYQAGRPVPEASDDDIEITGLSRWMPEVQKRLKDEEVRRVAMVMSRGGRFDTVDESWKDDHIKAAYKFPVQIWHEGLAKMRHSMTGERYAGCPHLVPDALCRWLQHARALPRVGVAADHELVQIQPDEQHVDRCQAPAPGPPAQPHQPAQGRCGTLWHCQRRCHRSEHPRGQGARRGTGEKRRGTRHRGHRVRLWAPAAGGRWRT